MKKPIKVVLGIVLIVITLLVITKLSFLVITELSPNLAPSSIVSPKKISCKINSDCQDEFFCTSDICNNQNKGCDHGSSCPLGKTCNEEQSRKQGFVQCD